MLARCDRKGTRSRSCGSVSLVQTGWRDRRRPNSDATPERPPGRWARRPRGVGCELGRLAGSIFGGEQGNEVPPVVFACGPGERGADEILPAKLPLDRFGWDVLKGSAFAGLGDVGGDG